ncbi:hypothetical protein WA026_016980 [Henosepilachna vigintioctopunctata]|uniref:DNA polymerase epsilon subunit 3 n=1 Tax=Henosepilachna vigintioctopunctata TaxID=420089 RepID=A0AAW1U2U4_9CUCU
MAERLEDLNLPNAPIQKIIKEALPESVHIGKDARSALSRAASVFVLYITSQASKQAQKFKRKTLSGQDVMNALSDLGFEEFLEPLEEFLKSFQDSKGMQKKRKMKNVTADDPEIAEVDEIEDSADENIEDD